MLVFASYYYDYDCGDHIEHYAVVVAETRAVALGLLLERYERTTAANWEIKQVETSVSGVTDV